MGKNPISWASYYVGWTGFTESWLSMVGGSRRLGYIRVFKKIFLYRVSWSLQIKTKTKITY